MPASMSVSSAGRSSYTSGSLRSYDSLSMDENMSFVTKARNIMFTLMYFLNKETNRQISSPLRTFLFIIELVQFLTFVIDPSLPYWDVDGSKFGQAMRYLTYIRTIRLPYSSQVVFLWVIVGYVAVVLCLGLELAIVSLKNGEGTDSKRLRLLCFMTMGLLPVFYTIFIDTLFGFLDCKSDSSGNSVAMRFASEGITCNGGAYIAFMGFSFTVLLLLIPTMGTISLFVYQPHLNNGKQEVKSTMRDMVNGRLLFIFAVAKTMLVLFLQFGSSITPISTQEGLYTWLGMIVTGTLFIYCVYFLPFFNKYANLMFSMFMAASFFGFLTGFAVSNNHSASGQMGLIAFLVIFIPFAAIVGALVYFFRIRPLYNWKYDHAQQFKRSFEVEICTRAAMQKTVPDEDSIVNTFTLGLEQYPDNGFLHAAYAVFLLEKKSDFHLLTITIDRARNTTLPTYLKFLVFYIERERLNTAMALDGGAEEIHKKLNAVKKHSKRARMYIKTFWDTLLKEEDLDSLPEIVTSIEIEEKRANAILQKLREKFPRNVTVLRHYAVFLEKVKNDPEAAQAVLKAADDIEEEKAVRHRNKAAKKLKKSKELQKAKAIQSDKTKSRSGSQSVTVRKSDNSIEPTHDTNRSDGSNNSGQVRFKEVSRLYSPQLPNTVNEDVDTEDLIAGVLAVDSSRDVANTSHVIIGSDDESHYQPSGRVKSPINRSHEFLRPSEMEMDEYDEALRIPDKSTQHRKNVGGMLGAGKQHHVVDMGASNHHHHNHNNHHEDTESGEESDKASSITGSSFSFEQLKNMKRSDLLRYRKYRYLTENSRSKALSKLRIAINVTLFILLVDVVVVFAVTQLMITTFNGSINDVTNASNANYLMHDAALSVQELRAACILRQNDTAAQLRDTMTSRMSKLSSLMTSLYAEDSSYAALTDGWKSKDYTIGRWSVASQTTTYYQKSMWDAISEFIWRVEQVSMMDDSQMRLLKNSVDLHFVLDNGPTEIYRALENLVQLFMDKNAYVTRILTIMAIVLIFISFGTLCLLVMLLSRPATAEIRSERSDMLKLFLSIPKSSISAVCKKISAAEDEEEDRDQPVGEDDLAEVRHAEVREEFFQYNGNSGQVPILKSFIVRYLTSMVLIFLGCLIICILAVVMSRSVNGHVAEIRAATQERVLASRIHAATLNIKFAKFDALPFAPLKAQISADAPGLLNLDYDLRFGNKSAGLPGGFNSDTYLMNVYYGGACPNLTQYNQSCAGLASAFQVFVEAAMQIARMDDANITYFLTQYNVVEVANTLYITEWLKDTRDYYMSLATSAVSRTNVVVIVMFILLLPGLVLVNFTLRPLLGRIKDENTRTVKMLLILPFDVIDSIHPIRDFLNTGQYNSNKNAKTKNKGINFVGTSGDELMKTIFLRNSEPIIVTSAAGEIDVFNPRAEELFGVVKKEVFGKHFSSLLVSEDSTKYSTAMANLKSASLTAESSKEVIDVKGRCRSECGQNIIEVALQICVSYEKVGGKVYIVHYVKDLSTLRSVQEQAQSQSDAFSLERKKMTDFMYNVFPDTIAEQLMKEADGKKMIAEEYKEVTVLFADLVGFTAMCSRLEPAILLLILNGIFSKWDALVNKYNLQKIKTIGDCYMVAGGVPERTIDHAARMLDFGMEMKEALEEYNRTSNILLTRGITLNMRVGINTGPVVAGIIGETRMCFDLWGDAVNVASRMESTSVEGRIQVSHSTFTHARNDYEFEERTAEVKGKGMMLTYLLVGKRFYRSASGTLLDLRFMKHSMGSQNSEPNILAGTDIMISVSGTSITNNNNSNNNDNNNNTNNNNNNSNSDSNRSSNRSLAASTSSITPTITPQISSNNLRKTSSMKP